MAQQRSSSSEPVILGSRQPAAPTVSGLAGSYRILRLLGRGTMASVYLAEQVSMARAVALKILSPSLANDPSFLERFIREARASGRLNHPNIVAAIDFGEADSCFFLAREYVDGESLAAILKRDGSLGESRVIEMGLQVVSALEHAASHNVIHLDIKPANIMIRKDGQVKLTDFGLAMILDSPGGAEISRRVVGTPYYMAPEQVEGGRLDWRTDQFSLGASLYEAVTGQRPFEGNSVSDILVKRFFEKPEPAWNAGRKKASREFSAVLAKMLSRSPDGRYQSFEELTVDFGQVGAGKKPVVAGAASSTARATPGVSAWESFGYSSVLSRVNEVSQQAYWRICAYSSLLLLAILGCYGLARAREIVGPAPAGRVRLDMLSAAERLPENVETSLRDAWVVAFRLMLRVEQEPEPQVLRQAAAGLRALAEDPKFAGTIYVQTARRSAERFERQLERMEGARPGGGGGR